MGILTGILSVLFFGLALYVSAFSLWRIFEREHVEDIPAGADRICLAALLSWFLSRVPSFLDLYHTGGFSVLSLLSPFYGTASWQVAVTLFLVIFFYLSRKLWKDAHAILDYTVVALCVFLALFFLSRTVLALIAVLAGNGRLALPHLVVSCAGMLYFLGLSRILAHIELQYRTYFWYRYRRSSAQTGFVTSIYLMGVGLYGILSMIAYLPFALLSAGMIELLWSLFLVVAGFVLLFIRSGRLKR